MFLTFETIMSQLSGAKRFVAKQAIKKRIVNGITTSIIQISLVCFAVRQFARQCFQQLYQLRHRKFQLLY